MSRLLVSACGLTSFISCEVSHAAQPHAVVVAGTHHYSPHRRMPGLAAELGRLGFRTTLVNPDWDPEKDERGLPGLDALESADEAVFFVRFLKLSETQLGHILRYVESGKPAFGLRTSTHAFNYAKDHPRHVLNGSFGRDVFGAPCRTHLRGGTRVVQTAAETKTTVLPRHTRSPTAVFRKWSLSIPFCATPFMVEV